jgi:ActR/RegA family two-component response regulator
MNAMQKQCAFQSDELHTKSVLIVEDDKRLMHCLTLAMEARGFEVMNAESVLCDSSNKSACPRVRSRRPKIGRRMRIRRYLGA